MFWLKRTTPPKTLENDLRSLVKSFDNIKIKSLIKSSHPSDLIDGTGTTIFHLAARYSNLDLISILLSSGYCVNIRDEDGTTPLLMASLRRNFEVVKVLLDANADVFATNSVGENPLRLLVLLDENNDVPISVSRRLVSNLMRNRASDEQLARLLLEAGCPMEFALMLENADVTRLMLRQTEEISMDRAYDLLLAAMRSNYLENINVLLHNGHKAGYRREKFLENIVDRLNGTPSDLESARPFLMKLADWNVVDEVFVQTLEKMFAASSQRILNLLLECEIDVFVWTKFRRHLLVHMFVNRSENVMDLLRDRPLDVDARDKDGQTGLHAAARVIFPERIDFLLERGANPNVKDKCGRTALHYAWEVECIVPLLRGGADVHVIDYSGMSVFDRTKNLSESMQVLIAQLAVVEAKGVTIKRKISDSIASRVEFQGFWDRCRTEVGWMREKKVRDEVTIFEVMAEKMEGLVLDRDVVEMTTTEVREYGVFEFYAVTLEEKFRRILEQLLGSNR